MVIYHDHHQCHLSLRQLGVIHIDLRVLSQYSCGHLGIEMMMMMMMMIMVLDDNLNDHLNDTAKRLRKYCPIMDGDGDGEGGD